MARRFRRVRCHRSKTLTVGNEVRDRQLLISHDHHIVVEPSLVNLIPGRLVHCLDVDTGDFDTNLRPDPANLEHPHPPMLYLSRVNTCLEEAATPDSAMPTRERSITTFWRPASGKAPAGMTSWKATAHC